MCINIYIFIYKHIYNSWQWEQHKQLREKLMTYQWVVFICGTPLMVNYRNSTEPTIRTLENLLASLHRGSIGGLCQWNRSHVWVCLGTPYLIFPVIWNLSYSNKNLLIFKKIMFSLRPPEPIVIKVSINMIASFCLPHIFWYLFSSVSTTHSKDGYLDWYYPTELSALRELS